MAQWERICLQCRRHRFDPWVGKILCPRKWQPVSVFLPGEPHDQRSLAGYSPCIREKSLQFCLTLRPHGLKPARLLCPCDSPGTNTGVGCRDLLQGIFLTQGSNPHLLGLPVYLHWQVSSLQLVPPGKRVSDQSFTQKRGLKK